MNASFKYLSLDEIVVGNYFVRIREESKKFNVIRIITG